MHFLRQALEAIPNAAQSPLAFGAYIVTILAWLIIAYRGSRLGILLKRIADIPARDRRSVVEAEFGRPLPANISADDFLRIERQRYFFAAFLVLVAIVALVLILATYVAATELRSIRESVESVAFSSDPPDYLTAGEIPVGARCTLRLENIPPNASVSWTQTTRGQLDSAAGASTQYTADSVGYERIQVQLFIHGLRFSKETALRVVDPFQ
jgi:hypothetical protein